MTVGTLPRAQWRGVGSLQASTELPTDKYDKTDSYLSNVVHTLFIT